MVQFALMITLFSIIQFGPMTTFAPIDTFSPILDSLEITAEGCITGLSISKIDFFDQMDKNDPPFFIVNYGKNTKPKNIADFHHHPLHAKELKKKADLLNIKNVIYATGIGIIDKSRQGLVDFIVENLR